VRAHFNAYEKRDLKALSACLSEDFSTQQVPNREAYLKRFATVFEKLGSASYQSTIKSIQKNPNGTVVVRLDFEGKLRVKGQTEDVPDEGRWAVLFRKQNGVWKWDKLVDDYTYLVRQALGAKSEVERIAIFRADNDSVFVSEFFANLMKEQKQLLDNGEIGKAELCLLLLDDAVLALEDDSDRSLYDGLVLHCRGTIFLIAERYDEAVAIFQRLLFRYHMRG